MTTKVLPCSDICSSVDLEYLDAEDNNIFEKEYKNIHNSYRAIR